MRESVTDWVSEWMKPACQKKQPARTTNHIYISNSSNFSERNRIIELTHPEGLVNGAITVNDPHTQNKVLKKQSVSRRARFLDTCRRHGIRISDPKLGGKHYVDTGIAPWWFDFFLFCAAVSTAQGSKSTELFHWAARTRFMRGTLEISPSQGINKSTRSLPGSEETCWCGGEVWKRRQRRGGGSPPRLWWRERSANKGWQRSEEVEGGPARHQSWNEAAWSGGRLGRALAAAGMRMKLYAWLPHLSPISMATTNVCFLLVPACVLQAWPWHPWRWYQACINCELVPHPKRVTRWLWPLCGGRLPWTSCWYWDPRAEHLW